MKSFTSLQIAIRDAYENGDFSHITNSDEAKASGDPFLAFLLDEFAPNNCDDFETALDHLATLHRELDQIEQAILSTHDDVLVRDA